ncbi:hydrolase [Vibrio vulnificus]|uniref:hydrolase n=1 Tax=Vibrio vulnificus TaxID=672 RepID=UPI000CD01992|nr:hydrolase [Vibrio vulnificus]EGS1994413.1 hydrolase [Vibrio vulnificus]EHD2233404.1 hydrolase [Vibrio vulnificus]EHK9067043.1 hydrolase [Vibrio vulnificus]EHT4875407.1 hydrolase [Vibrio vulnificus]EHU4800447.1 hydrolase [Vibrio vulnificus]
MLEKENTGLIVVDVQGKLAQMVDQSEQMITNITKLIEGAKMLGLPIIWLEQIPENLGATVGPIANALQGYQPFHKSTFSGCGTETISNAIQASEVEQWLLCGIEAHICVYQTAVDLKQMGYQVEVVTDCVSSRTPQNKALALRKFEANGIGLSGLEMALFELMRDGKCPEFRQMLPLFK